MTSFQLVGVPYNTAGRLINKFRPIAKIHFGRINGKNTNTNIAKKTHIDIVRNLTIPKIVRRIENLLLFASSLHGGDDER
mmetsp:Transcript_20182/g.42633  ORF Transcript_20182/g.42633 Transcript_20182/m.42633 type:complete len:80 (-) Transcript_20182:91-330(-)